MPEQSIDLLGALAPAAPAKSAMPPGPPTHSQPSGPPAMDLLGTMAPGPPASKPVEKKQAGNLLTDSLSKTITGKSLSERYEGSDFRRTLEAIIPGSIRAGAGGDFVGRFTNELYKAAPEMVDVATSPAGVALLAAHVIPQTRAIAGAVDMVLGAMQGASGLQNLKKFHETHEPEDMARAFVDLAGAYGIFKGGKAARGSDAPIPVTQRESRLAMKKIMETAPEERRQVLVDLAESFGSLEGPPGAESIGKRIIRQVGPKIVDKPGIGVVAKALGIPGSKVFEIGRDLVFDRSTLIAERMYETNRMIHEIAREVAPDERTVQKLGYVIQGSKTADEVGLSREGRAAADRIREYQKTQDKMLREAYGDEVGLLEGDYLAQIWDWGQEPYQGRTRAANTLMNDPFLKQRKVESYRQGIEEFGFKPKYDDVLDILKVRSDYAAKAVANSRMSKVLREMGAVLTKDEVAKITKSTGDNQYMGWEKLSDVPAMNRATYGSTVKRGVGQEAGQVFRFDPVYVHPDIAPAVRAVFAPGFDGRLYNGMETVRAFGKKHALSYSMFHHWALSEQGQAIATSHGQGLGAKVSSSLKNTFFLNREFYRGAKSGLWEAFGQKSPDSPPTMRMKLEDARDWVRAGLNLTSEEIEAKAVSQMKNFTGNNIVTKAAQPAIRFLGHVNHVMDRALWDYYHQGQQMNAAETILSSELSKRMKMGDKLSEAQVGELRRNIADHVNNVFGSANLERLLLEPKTRQALNFLLLAPNWTLSNIRVLAGGFENEAGMRLSGKYVAGAAISWFLTTQLFNYALSKYYGVEDRNGKKGGHFTWDNAGAPLVVNGKRIPGATENIGNIAAGYNLDGTQRMIRFGKGFREPFQWMVSPIETLGAKLSIPVRQGIVLITGHEPGSGFEVINPKATPWEQVAQRLSYMSGIAMPFTLRDTQRKIEHGIMPEVFPEATSDTQWKSLPTARGLSRTHAIEVFSEAMERGDHDTAREVLRVAEQNHIAPSSIRSGYKSRKNSRERTAEGPRRRYTERGELVK